MSEKRFTIHKESKYKEEWYAYPFCIKEDGEVVFNTIPLSIAEKVRDKLNELQATIDKLDQENADLLGARIKAQEEWEKCTDKLKAKILEQQATITALNEENIELKKLRKYCAEWMGVKEENLYDVVR